MANIKTYSEWCNDQELFYDVMPAWYWRLDERIDAYNAYVEGVINYRKSKENRIKRNNRLVYLMLFLLGSFCIFWVVVIIRTAINQGG